MEDFKPFQFGKASDKKEEDKTAVAISYDPGDAAPKILAAGTEIFPQAKGYAHSP